MKKILSILLCMIVVLSIGSCSSGRSYTELMENYGKAINSREPEKIVNLYMEPFWTNEYSRDEWEKFWLGAFATMERVYGENFKVTISNVTYDEEITDYSDDDFELKLEGIDKLKESNTQYDECARISISGNISGSEKTDEFDARLIAVKINDIWYIYNDYPFIGQTVAQHYIN